MREGKNLFQNPIILALLALFSCFLWGSAFPCVKLGYKLFEINSDDTYGKIVFAGMRFMLSGSMVFSLCLLKNISLKVNKIQFKNLVCLGTLQTFIQYIFFYIGMSYVSGTNGSIISSLSTFISVIMAHFFFLKDRLNLRKLLGVLIGILGIIILNIKDISDFKITFHGEGFIFVSTITSALSGIYTKKVSSKNINPFLISGYQLLIGGIFLTIFGLIGTKGRFLNFNVKGLLIFVYMGFISAAAFSIWTILLKYNEVSKVTIYRSSIPLFGVFLSIFLLGEKNLNYFVIISIVFVVTGIILINSENLFNGLIEKVSKKFKNFK